MLLFIPYFKWSTLPGPEIYPVTLANAYSRAGTLPKALHAGKVHLPSNKLKNFFHLPEKWSKVKASSKFEFESKRCQKKTRKEKKKLVLLRLTRSICILIKTL